MHFKVIEYQISEIPCSICHKKSQYEILLYRTEGIHVPLGYFCKKHFKELQNEMKQVSEM